jgi:hypothetical protein
MAEPPLAAGCTTNWRREADERLRRLHSLLFGADAALEHGDATVAQALALRLLGFLDSQALAAGAGPEDAAFVAPIRTAASARLAAASRARASDSDRYGTPPSSPCNAPPPYFASELVERDGNYADCPDLKYYTSVAETLLQIFLDLVYVVWFSLIFGICVLDVFYSHPYEMWMHSSTGVAVMFLHYI